MRENVEAALHFLEEMRDLRVRTHRLAGVVGQQVLLRNISDVGGLRVFRPAGDRTAGRGRGRNLFRDRSQPLLGVGEHRIDVEK